GYYEYTGPSLVSARGRVYLLLHQGRTLSAFDLGAKATPAPTTSVPTTSVPAASAPTPSAPAELAPATAP
ncbi:MAG TPA: hypothetical protein VHO25_18520, partial [Polyangiaceae bacterium]|nr:hypothetical protein [Polyangiaceae bacterium]